MGYSPWGCKESDVTFFCFFLPSRFFFLFHYDPSPLVKTIFPWGHKELDMTLQLNNNEQQHLSSHIAISSAAIKGLT